MEAAAYNPDPETCSNVHLMSHSTSRLRLAQSSSRRGFAAAEINWLDRSDVTCAADSAEGLLTSNCQVLYEMRCQPSLRGCDAIMSVGDSLPFQTFQYLF